MNEQALLAAIGTLMDEKLEAVKTEVGALMDKKLEAVKTEVGALMDEKLEAVKTEVGALMDEKLEARLKPIEERLTGVEGRVTGIEERLTATEKETHELKILMENETNRAVGLVLDGHESLRQMIEGRLVTKDEREQDRIRICTLEGVTKLHTTQIAELKKKIV
ncbi:MAG: hypothetical protein HFF13_08470 [Angelakisella sp.]|jgi:hypothetical protein|nr:hypothetical protein [Angelakisella sp.]